MNRGIPRKGLFLCQKQAVVKSEGKGGELRKRGRGEKGKFRKVKSPRARNRVKQDVGLWILRGKHHER